MSIDPNNSNVKKTFQKAIEENNPVLVKKLLKDGLDPNIILTVDGNPIKGLHYAIKLYDNRYEPDSGFVIKSLSSKKDTLNRLKIIEAIIDKMSRQTDYYLNYLLIKILLTHVSRSPTRKLEEINEKLRLRLFSLFTKLLNKGADPNDKRRTSPLILSIYANKPVYYVEILLNYGANPNVKWGINEETPLILALKYLVNLNEDINSRWMRKLDRDFWADYSENNLYDIVNLLLNQKEVDINLKDGSGLTALDVARRLNDKQIIEKLREKGAIDSNLPSSNGSKKKNNTEKSSNIINEFTSISNLPRSNGSISIIYNALNNNNNNTKSKGGSKKRRKRKTTKRKSKK